MICSECQTKLPEGARFCFNCGAPQESKVVIPSVVDESQPIPPQLSDWFFRIWRGRLLELKQLEEEPKFQEVLYKSGFRDLLHRRCEQLASEWDKPTPPNEQRVEQELEALCDHFFIHHAREICAVELPAAILKYLGRTDTDDLSLGTLVHDYLKLEDTQTRYFDNLLEMPEAKLKNANNQFLKVLPKERIFFILDQSLLGSFKQGFAMTDRAVYWKGPGQEAHRVAYVDLAALVSAGDWLEINGHYFNVNHTINIRMLYLLRRLRKWLSVVG